MNIALIVFAGIGERLNSSLPKQFIRINNKELVAYTIDTFEACKEIDEIVLVTHPQYVDYVKEMVDRFHYQKVRKIIPGGESRQASVRLGLEGTSYRDEDVILIHDGDRPLVSKDIIKNNIKYINNHDLVCTYIIHNDALKEVSNLGRCKVVGGVDFDIQTPQTFRYGMIKKYHELKKNESFSDDISLLENDYRVYYLKGDPYNFKITTPKDLEFFKEIVDKRK